MNLQEFYKNIPERSCPKTEWIKMTAKKLNVSQATVRTWVYGKNKPREQRLYKELSYITGIPENELFNDI